MASSSRSIVRRGSTKCDRGDMPEEKKLGGDDAKHIFMAKIWKSRFGYTYDSFV